MAYCGITESMPDEEEAYLETRSLFADNMARIYVDKYLTEEMRDEIRQLCQDAADTYKVMIDDTDWLSDETKEQAKYKLEHITINALYPDKWEDDSMFFVTPKKDGGSYLQAILDYNDSIIKRAQSHINEKVDKEIWGVDILQTNAFYTPQNNSINIIPGFLCSATYSSDMTIEEKYGALGSVIGHEISHAFDTNGAQYDADGNIKDWWGKEDYDAFMKRAGKLVDYYDKVVAFDDGTEYHGQVVQTEAIADMAGIKCMLKMAEKIEDFDYDKFFRANTYLWARVTTLEGMESGIATDPHPLHYLRCNVTLQQYDEFYDTYDIKEGDGMYLAPEDRIAVW
ncbi:MAG: M13 family metallopeptidase [Lachnospiraceae bacterium]|nr:M13 family metallopeptidase [Lachnospiraceae bacterium]